MHNHHLHTFIPTATLLLLCLGRIQSLAQAAAPDVWLRDTNTGVQIWNPVPTAGESVQWFGTKDIASGAGTAIWFIHGTETEQAAGEWNGGTLHGYAVWRHQDGSRYEGQWRHGRKHGLGIYTWPDGTRFCGLYEEGIRKTGAFYSRNGKALCSDLAPLAIRQQVFDAEIAAIQARKAASLARRQIR